MRSSLNERDAARIQLLHEQEERSAGLGQHFPLRIRIRPLFILTVVAVAFSTLLWRHLTIGAEKPTSYSPQFPDSPVPTEPAEPRIAQAREPGLTSTRETSPILAGTETANSFIGDRSDMAVKRNNTEDPEAAFAQRKETVAAVCERMQENPDLTNQTAWAKACSDPKTRIMKCFTHFVVLDEINTSFCLIPKVASRNIQDYLGQHTNGSHRIFKEDMAADKLERYVNIVVSRNPLDRLLSAWNDKLYPTEHPYFDYYTKEILSKFRKENVEGGSLSAKSPMLHEFFEYLVAGGYTMNQHWNLAHEACLICYVKFDYYVKLESLQSDFQYVATKILGKNSAKFVKPPFRKNVDRYSLLNKVPRELVEKVLKIYQADYDLFGYDMEEDLRAVYGY